MRVDRPQVRTVTLAALEILGAYLVAGVPGLVVSVPAVVCARLLGPTGPRMLAGVALGFFLVAGLATALGPDVVRPEFVAQRPLATHAANLSGALVLISLVEFARRERTSAPQDSG